MPSQNYYETAQICQSGHLITKHYDLYPVERKDFCPTCASPTIHECPNCHKSIQGCLHTSYQVPNLARPLDSLDLYETYPEYTNINECANIDASYVVPAYCYNCGHPYPWIKSTLDEANLLISMSEELSANEIERVNELFPDLLTQRPHTVSSAITISRILSDASPFLRDSLKAGIADKLVSSALKFLGW
ncbi:DUF2321 domain-containing protein [Selenomonas sp. oral taxon 136]|uniref:DUF2321 domain-containing protein n=1 Tax=Selenomonas sp. oral taxon 136 TaxID=713030 RepID=UPI0009005AE8